MNKNTDLFKPALILFTLWFAASTSAAIPKGAVIFEDDFETGTINWIGGDKGTIVDGWYHLRGQHQVLHRVAVKDSGEWTDYIVEFDLKIVNVIASWMVRCELDPSPSRHYLFCFNGREFERNVMLDQNRPAGEISIRTPVRHGESHRVTIVVKGNTIKHYIDGELIDRFTDGSLTRGGFGFRQMNREEGLCLAGFNPFHLRASRNRRRHHGRRMGQRCPLDRVFRSKRQVGPHANGRFCELG